MIDYKLKIVVPDLTPTNNVLLRMSWRRRHALNKSWVWLIKAALMMNDIDLKKFKFSKKRHVEIHSFRKKLPDENNLVGGAKCLIDALVANKVLIDDDPKHLTLVVQGEIDLGEQRTEIYIK